MSLLWCPQGWGSDRTGQDGTSWLRYQIYSTLATGDRAKCPTRPSFVPNVSLLSGKLKLNRPQQNFVYKYFLAWFGARASLNTDAIQSRPEGRFFCKGFCGTQGQQRTKDSSVTSTFSLIPQIYILQCKDAKETLALRIKEM